MISVKRMVVNIVGAVLTLLLTARLVYHTYRMFNNSMYQLTMPHKVTQILTLLAYVAIVAFLIAGIFAKVTKFSILGLVGLQIATILSFIVEIIFDRVAFNGLNFSAIGMMAIEYIVIIAIAVVLLLFFFNKINPIITFVLCLGGMIIYLIANLVYGMIVANVGIRTFLLGYIFEVVFYVILFGLPILAVALERKED